MEDGLEDCVGELPTPRSSTESTEPISYGSMDSNKPMAKQLRNQYVPFDEIDELGHFKHQKAKKKLIKQYASYIVREINLNFSVKIESELRIVTTIRCI